MASFSLATLKASENAEAVIVVQNKCYQLDESVRVPGITGRPLTCLDLLRHWDAVLPALNDITAKASKGSLQCHSVVDSTTQFASPIMYPNKLLAVGANYAGHLREMGLPAEKWVPMPYFFRPPTTSIVGPGRTVRKPRSTEQFDWEIELVLVLGKRLRHTSSVSEAEDAIAGYTIGMDLSCRDLQVVKDIGMDIGRGKAQDTLAPCGPLFVPKQSLQKSVNDLGLKLSVNGSLMVDGNTNDMLYSPAEVLVEMSKYTTLEPGDMVFTGAPAGSAKSHGGKWLQVGDQIRAEIEGLGVLEVEVIADD